MTTPDFRESREAMLDRQERQACLFVGSCGVLIAVVWAGLLIVSLV